jgi:NADPH:quinone reductase-like Zn-dependent oxidoreductase
MRAWQINETGGIDAYSLAEVDDPEPGPGQVRIDLRVSALNHLDLWVSQGLPAPKHLPHTGGADGAGVVDAVGEGVAGFDVGDEIIIDPSMSCGHCSSCRNDDIVYCESFAILGEHLNGTFCDKIVIPAINAVRKPKSMSWDVAGSFGLTTATALRMLERADLRPEQRLLVVGIGSGVSTSALILGLSFRAEVYVTSRSPEKIARAIEMGAAGGFDSAGEFGKEMSEIGGADVVIENVGPATMRQSMRAARPGGKIAICGSTSGPKMELTLPHLFFRQLEFIGSSMSTHGQFARATTWISQGPVEFPVGRVFDFEQLPDALRFLDSGEQLGKVALSH